MTGSKQPIISVSGLRGIVGESLTPDIVLRYVNAFLATLERRGPIVVSRDGRDSGLMIAQLVQGCIAAAGCDVLNADIAATPTTGILVRQTGAVGGIQVSASHNPRPYNGLKLFAADGRVVSATCGQSVLLRYDQDQLNWARHDRLGKFHVLEDTTTSHLEKILATVDVAAIRDRRFKVVLDSNRGAGSILGQRLLERLGCVYQILGDIPDGDFVHPPEPTSENLASTIEFAKQLRADAVFCQDPDADRLAIIDENGCYIGEEYTLAITAAHRLAKQSGPVVANCATSRMIADVAASFSCPFFLSAVGEANVTEVMIDQQAVYGGEGNGGPIDPQVGFVRDSFVAMAQVLDAMADQRKTISQFVSELPRYNIYKAAFQLLPEKVPELLNHIEKRFSEAVASRLDGLRLDWSDRWLLVRPSNTEPIVRAIAEATDLKTAQALCAVAAEISQQL
jgi:phosphomannomutase